MEETRVPIYLGIENEFQVHHKRKLVDFEKYFDELLREYQFPFFNKGPTAIRTRVGSAIYQDIEVAEVCTPPLQLQMGVATKVVDLLYLARKELVKFISPKRNLNLIGYSMHYNITDCNQTKKDEALKALAIPYQLFCMNPSSKTLRFRNSKNGKCLEMTSDYLYEEDQIMAFLNLFIGTIHRVGEKKNELPFIPDSSAVTSGWDEWLCDNKIIKGRNSMINVEPKKEKRSLIGRIFIKEDKNQKKISAQEYLEEYYRLFYDEIARFATHSEISNLESFIYGRRPLEADKSRKYSVYIKKKEDGWLKYDQRFILRKDDFGKDRELPGKIAKNLSRMAGAGTDDHFFGEVKGIFPLKILSLEWNELILDYNGGRYTLEGIHNFEIMENIMQSSDEHKWPGLIGQFAILSESTTLPELQAYATELLKNGNNGISYAAYNRFEGAGIIDKKKKLTHDGITITNAILDFKITS